MSPEMVAWLDANHPSTPPGRCCQCGAASDRLVAVGGRSIGYSWMHAECWPVWYEGRKQKAASALSVPDTARLL